MKVLFLNFLIISLIALPLIFLEIFAKKWRWLGENEGWISILLWLLMLFVATFFLAPLLGLAPTVNDCDNSPNSIYCNQY